MSGDDEKHQVTAPSRASIALIPIAIIAAIVIAFDQLTKWIALGNLTPGNPISLIGDWVQFSLRFNTGAAFSMATGMTWIFTIIATVVVIVVIRIARTLRSMWWVCAFGLLLGGAMGNLLDRIFRSPGIGRGAVIDFISVKYFAVFNVADIAITCAAILIVLLTLIGVRMDAGALSRGAQHE